MELLQTLADMDITYPVLHVISYIFFINISDELCTHFFLGGYIYILYFLIRVWFIFRKQN